MKGTIGLAAILAVCVADGVEGCRGRPETPGVSGAERQYVAAIDRDAFQQVFTAIDSVILEETPSVVTVSPSLFKDPRGGLLVADFLENQVRIYSPTGKLRNTFGGGNASGDSLSGPLEVARLGNGDVVATNLGSGRLSIMSADQDKPMEFLDTSVRPLTGVRVLDDNHVLLMGRRPPFTNELLHVWDLANRKIVRSFFAPPQHLDSNVVRILGTVHAASNGNRIAAMLNIADTLHVYDLDGTELLRSHIPVAVFVAPLGPLPNITSKAARQAWAEQFTLLSDLFWTSDDDIVVQSVTGSGDHVVFSLVQMSTTGQRRWVLPRTPELLSIHDGRFFFHDPNSDLPNRLIVAVLKVNVASNP